MLFADDLKREFTDGANEHLEGGLTQLEREEARAEIGEYFGKILRALRINYEGDHNTQDTPKRFAKMLVDELFQGRFNAPPTITTFPNIKKLDQLIVVGPLTVKSMCSHHFMPIVGNAWIAYLPSDKLIGLSKFPRIVEWFSRRPQIQEELTEQISHYLFDLLQPIGIGVYLRANHFCMSHRGVNEDASAVMDTIALKGALRDVASLKAEFLSAINRA